MKIDKAFVITILVGALMAYALHLVKQDQTAVGVIIGFIGKGFMDIIRNQFPVKNDPAGPSGGDA